MKLEDKFVYPLIWTPFLGLIVAIYLTSVGHWIIAIMALLLSLAITKFLIWHELHNCANGIGYFKARNGVSTLYKDSPLGGIIAAATGRDLVEVIVTMDGEDKICLMDARESLRCFSKQSKLLLVKIGELHGKTLYFARI